MWTRGQVESTVRKGKETEGAKFADYFEFSEPFEKLPRTASSRCSAARRKRSSR